MQNIKIKRAVQYMGNDLVITVQNENGHIGSVVTGEPYQKDQQTHVTFNTWNRLGHKDDIIATMYVKAVVLKCQCVVTCLCGIHIDDITQDEMISIIELVKDDIMSMEKEL